MTSPLFGLLLQDGWFPLYWAARNGQDEIVKMLLSEGAAIDAATNVIFPFPVKPLGLLMLPAAEPS
jgi:ankyrin repeat protein